MLGDLTACAWLASFLLIPIVLKRRGCTINSLFDLPASSVMRYCYVGVLVLQGAASVVWLTIELRILDQPVQLWAMALFLSYFWIRALELAFAGKSI